MTAPFTAVVTTGIYCRRAGTCSGRPLAHNTRPYDNAAAAEAAGFRPCLVCRPDRLPAPNWIDAPELVCRALRLISDGALDDTTEDALAARLGVSARHLRRLFVEHVGATPAVVARSNRAHFARRLLDDTDLTITEVGTAAGFQSVRQLNRVMKQVFHFTPQELLGFAFTEPNTFPPGEGFGYCNTNTILLGLVVEKVSGQPLHDYIRDHISTPLGMSDTIFPTDNTFPEPHAQGYTIQTANATETTATDWDPSWGWAAGAMISTLEDMHIWAPALATGKLLTPQMQAQRLQTVGAPGLPPQDGYGLGIFNLAGWVGHNGSLPGYQTVAVYLPEKQTTMVILTNTDIESQGAEPSTTVAAAITKELTPDHIYTLSPEVQEPDATPSPAPTTKPR